MAPALLFMFYAQWRVRSAYNKWGKVPNSHTASGTSVAQRLLSENGLLGVAVQPVPGEMTDNYDPRSKMLSLSQGSLQGTSVASMAIVAHEIGHARQDATGFALMALRSGLVPVVNFGSRLGPILFMIGFFFNLGELISPLFIWGGILLFASAFVFTLVTLPVELDASRRAMKMLTTSGLVVTDDDQRGARAVLSAAALTYVAAMLTAFLQLMYYVFLAGRRRR
jgi:Zn-dependent membrane protease YugP